MGQWVLLRNDRQKDFLGKFDVLWLGPYVMKEVFSNGSLLLETLALDFFLPERVGQDAKNIKYKSPKSR